MASSMVDPAIFELLQQKIDQETEVKESIRKILQKLEDHERSARSVLSRIHSTPVEKQEAFLTQAEGILKSMAEVVRGELATEASKYPYYKYNGLYNRQVQDLCYLIILNGWLTRTLQGSTPLLTIQEVASFIGVPIEGGIEDRFHLSIEEYLQGLISVVDELARLAVNSVTLGDYEQPLKISFFIKEVHAGFQILNLKNDSLRRRSDSIKYSVKKVEDVVYDLSLRNLIPKTDA